MTFRLRDLSFAAMLCGLLALFVGGTLLLMTVTVDRLLRWDAEATGDAWARYLANNLKDLPGIVAGERPTAESLAFLQRAQQVGQVFRYKVFDADGRPRLVSDQLDAVGSADGSLLEHNPAAAAVLRTGTAAVEAKEGTPPEGPAFFAEAYVPVMVGERTLAVVEVYVDQAEKRAFYRNSFAAATLALAGLTALAFGLPAAGFYWRTREKRAADARIDYLARHDPLTGLPNRAGFMAELDRAFRTGGRTAPIAFHYLDFDRLKEVNDTLGHEVGDAVLRTGADRLRGVVGPSEILARLGGDEFGIAQLDLTAGKAQAEGLAQRALGALAQPFETPEGPVSLTASIGIAISPGDGADTAHLVKSADIARYRAKSEGRGRHRFFAPEMDAELRSRRELEQLIRDALAQDRFDVHFQPLVRGQDRRLVGFEALLRLPTAEGGFISPAIFIPIAEETGLIRALGAWVVHYACHIAAHWPDPVRVAVNLSPAQFRGEGVCRLIREALAGSGLAASRLEVEITEGLLLADTDTVLRQLAELRSLGVSVAMDDFGTGYSSLSYLWKFPFDKIKIDGSFMRAFAAGDHNVRAILRTIVSLGGSLDLTVTAEGVETEAQAAFLAQIGCDELQGYHLGRPAPVGELAPILAANLRACMAGVMADGPVALSA